MKIEIIREQLFNRNFWPVVWCVILRRPVA